MNQVAKIQIDTSLQVTNFKAPEITIPPAVFEQKKLALREASEVEAVDNDMDQALAVGAMQKLKGITSGIEKSRKKLKEPFLEAGRSIDNVASDFVLEVSQAYTRLERMVSSFQDRERRRALEEQENARRALEEQNRLEAERQRKIAAGAKPKDVPAPPRLVVVAPPQAPAKTEGMSVTEDIHIEVVNLHHVYAFNPEFVKMDLKLAEVKNAVKMGLLKECPGLLITRTVKANVRA